MITPREFEEQMKEIEKEHGNNREVLEVKAMKIMCDVLVCYGYDAGVKILKGVK